MKNYLDGGEAILEAIRRLGVDYIISSPGSEWSPVWEALARQDFAQTKGPTYIDVWHETIAVNMALGYTRATGRMQVVLLHAGVGLLQGSMAIHATQMGEVPMVVMSGEALSYGENAERDPGSQWYRNLSIVGGPQRLAAPLVKWAQQVPSPETLYETIMRAGEMAQRTPKGPVYLAMPIETMLHPWEPPAYLRDAPPAPKPVAADGDVDRVARLLAEATSPVIVTDTGGADEESFEALVHLADSMAVPVVETRSAVFANFPKDNPMHVGFDAAKACEGADLVLLVRARGPWYPPSSRPAGATIVVLDETPFRASMVYQNLGADIYVEGFVASTLNRLAERAPELAAKSGGGDTGERRRAVAKRHDAHQASLRAAEAKVMDKSPLDPIALCRTVSESLPDDTIYVDETTTHSGLIQHHVAWNEPGRYFYVQGGLGQGLGVALGVKLAKRAQPVCLCIGDGSFLYNPALQGLGASRDLALPLLIVLFNNKRYQAMFYNLKSFYPDGVSVSEDNLRGVHINAPDFHHIAAAFDGVCFEADDRASLEKALADAMLAVKGGRTAIVNAHISR